LNKVLYTSLFGNYDLLKDPEIIHDDWDYICFSNHLNQKDFKVWEIRKLDTQNWSNVEASRFPKLCPHELLQDYEYSLYIDSNISISTDFVYKRASALEHDEEVLISIPKHPTRSCLYKEAEMLKYRGKDKSENIDRQIKMLEESGFPQEYGLFENNVIWRRHLNPKIVAIGQEWWRIFMEYSKRDQLGLVYCLWKYEVSCIPLMPDSIDDHRKCEHFEFSKHNQTLGYHINRMLSKFIYTIKKGTAPNKIKS